MSAACFGSVLPASNRSSVEMDATFTGMCPSSGVELGQDTGALERAHEQKETSTPGSSNSKILPARAVRVGTSRVGSSVFAIMRF